jgi:hypothetical protein
MEKSDAVSFTSSQFQVDAKEEKQTNPGVYGFALAHWLSDRLRERGVVPNDVVPEDWGWCVVVKTRPVRVNLAVSNVDGSSTRWRVFVFAERGFLQFTKGASDLRAEVAWLREHLTAIVSAVPNVQDVSWERLS